MNKIFKKKVLTISIKSVRNKEMGTELQVEKLDSRLRATTIPRYVTLGKLFDFLVLDLSSLLGRLVLITSEVLSRSEMLHILPQACK